MARTPARSPAGSPPPATSPSTCCAICRARSGDILACRPRTTRLLGAFLPPLGRFDDEGLDAGGLHPHTEAGEPVIPGDPWLVAGPESVDSALGQGEFVQRNAFCGCLCHAIMVSGIRNVRRGAHAALAFISVSIRSAIFCAGSRSCPIIQSAE